MLRHLVTLLAFCAGMSANAQDDTKLDCKPALLLATLAFDRVNDQKRLNNDQLAYDLRLSFWDVHKLSSHCPAVGRLAMRLAVMGLDEGAKRPIANSGAQANVSAIPWMKNGKFECPAGLKCGFITGGGSGNSKGAEGNIWYVVPKDFAVPSTAPKR